MHATEARKTMLAHFERARAQHMAGNLAEAERLHRAALAIDPGFADSLHALGMICFATKRIDEAIENLHAAALRQPQAAAIHNNLGVALAAAGRREAAAAAYRRVTELVPTAADPWCNLGRVLFELDRPAEALPCLQNAARLAPGDAGVLFLCGETLARLGRYGDAVAAFDGALRLRPDFAAAHGRKGLSLAALGRLQDASAALRTALKYDPTSADVLFALADLGRIRQDDSLTAEIAAALEQAAARPAAERCRLHFAYAKALDDLCRPAEAFPHFERGNALARAAIPYDEAQALESLRAIAARFPAETLAHSAGCPSALPLFVLGMPRSGTTLVEQILAGLPGVFGAGELPDLPALVAPNLDGATKADWRALGEAYAVRLAALAPGAARVIDKLPLNFRLIGAIRLMLPNARIVHVRRDPLDTCFSCFAKLFSDDLPFANDQRELGRYYRAYEGLMAHWRAALPEGAMLEVQYEDLVQNPAQQARRMADFCGLDWDEACLAFHESRRTVVTASIAQVRQPLYKTAIGRAAPYAPWLGPLRQALELP